MAKIHVNGSTIDVQADGSTPLLWVLRDHLDLTGTKFGCGVAQCGACTIHIDGKAVRSCVYPLSAVNSEQKITTIEGLSAKGDHPVQQAWEQLDTPQCGYCQPGMIMASAALLQQKAKPSDQDINENITNICRCGTFDRVRAGIHLASDLMSGNKSSAVSTAPLDHPYAQELDSNNTSSDLYYSAINANESTRDDSDPAPSHKEMDV